MSFEIEIPLESKLCCLMLHLGIYLAHLIKAYTDGIDF